MKEQGFRHTRHMQYKRIKNVQKIAILRANGIGDFVFTLPAIAALRKTYPSAEIVLLARDWHIAFLKNRPSPIDRVISIPTYPGITMRAHEEETEKADPAAIEQFFSDMVCEHFDMALQIHGGGRYSNPFVSKLGARVTAGLRTPDAASLDLWLPYIYFQHEIIRYNEVVSLIGATPTEIEPHLSVTEDDIIESLNIVPKDRQPLVVLHPGASDPKRRWSPAKFAAVGNVLAAKGAKIVVTGSGDESILARSVVEQMNMPALDLSNKLSLNGLTGLLSRAHLMVSNDTGPLHIATAVGTPTVSIYWCINIITASPLMRMKNRPFISWRSECPVCGANCLHKNCQHHASLVNDIGETEVIEAAQELYDRR